MTRTDTVVALCLVLAMLAACAPERGSDKAEYPMSAPDPLICDTALTVDRTRWETRAKWLPYVREAQGRGHSVEGCRRVLGSVTAAAQAERAAKVAAVQTKPTAPPPEPPKSERIGSGSGFVVSVDGVVLTNHHVVDECGTVQIGHGRSEAMAQGRVIANDRKSDLALIKAKQPLGPSATFRHGRGLRPGDDIVVVGFPWHGLLASEAGVTKGTVSALAGPGDDRRMIQITEVVPENRTGV